MTRKTQSHIAIDNVDSKELAAEVLKKTKANMPEKSIFTTLQSRVLTGFFIVIPLFLSLFITWWAFTSITDWAVNICERSQFSTEYISKFWLEWIIRISALIFIFSIFLVAGYLTQVAFGKKLLALLQGMFLKMPVVRFIYSLSKQLSDALSSTGSSSMFRKVVLFEYPRKGCYAVGLMVTDELGEFEVAKKLNTPLVAVFMPTAPNPTSGFLLFVPREDCTFLDMPVTDAMRIIVSCGAVLSGEQAAEVSPPKAD